MRARRASPQTPLVPRSTASSRFAAGHGLDLVDRSVERQDLVDACGFGLGDEVGLGEVEAVDFVDLECRPGDGPLAPLAMTWTPASGVTVRSRSRDRAEDLLRFGTGPELSRARFSAWVLPRHRGLGGTSAISNMRSSNRVIALATAPAKRPAGASRTHDRFPSLAGANRTIAKATLQSPRLGFPWAAPRLRFRPRACVRFNRRRRPSPTVSTRHPATVAGACFLAHKRQ